MSAHDLPENVLEAVWNAIDVAEHFAAGFVDALQNPPDNRSHWPLDRIANVDAPEVLAAAFTAWMNACVAAYQPPKPIDAP